MWVRRSAQAFLFPPTQAPQHAAVIFLAKHVDPI